MQSPEFDFPQSKRSWGNQISNNFQQNVGHCIAHPIFNSYQARSNYERSKVDIKNQEIVKEQADQKLKQDIYTAYTIAVAAFKNSTRAKVVLLRRKELMILHQRGMEWALVNLGTDH